jgi:protein TonB
VALALALLLHAAIILLFLLFARERKPPSDDQSQQGVSVVFDNGGQTQTAAPPAPRQGPTSLAEAPPPAAPPPPPQQANQAPPEVNLDLPPMPFADVQSAPQIPMPPQPQAQPNPAPRHVQRPQPTQKYTVMNGMSYGNPSNPAPPMPNARPGMNLSLAQSDAQAVMAPDVSIRGDVGADWGAALTKWVNDHAYYPQAAAEQGQQGTAEVEFTVDRAGNVTGLHLLSSAGSPFLDQAWLDLFAQNQLPPFPPGTKADHVVVDYTVHYQLIQ